MNEDEELLDQYRKEVEWLIQRVPRDDIYDFTQVIIVSSQHLLQELSKYVDLDELMNKDPVIGSWIKNITDLIEMKMNGFEGVIIPNISIRKK